MKAFFLVGHILVFSLVAIVFPSQAQNLSPDEEGKHINGRIMDAEMRQPVVGASVAVKSLADSLITGTVTDSNGRFQVAALKAWPYKVEVSFLGFETISKTVNQGDDLNFGTLLMVESSKLLGEVIVEGEIPIGEMRGDTTVYNAGAFRTRENAVAEDLISKLPGVTIQNGRVQAQGEEVQKVLVDGREFFGNDPSIALRNLPSDMIESVEILDQRSDQSRLTGLDDGNYAKTINIITKGNMRNSQFGRLFAGYGVDDRYAAGGNINFFKDDKRISVIGLFNNVNQQNFSSDDLLGVSGGIGRGRMRGGGGRGGGFSVGPENGIVSTNSIGINYSDKWGEKINFTGSYFFNSTENRLVRTTNRETIISEDQRQYYQERLFGTVANNNHRINGRMEYDINENHAIIISPSISFQDNLNRNDTDGLNLGDGLDSLSAARTISDNGTGGYNFSNNLTYRYKFEKRGRTLSANLSLAMNKRDRLTEMLTINRDFVRSAYDTLIQETNALSDGFNYRANLTYTEPINDRSIATVNYQIGDNKSVADQKTFQLANEQGIMVLDTALSNGFDNKFTTQRAGIGYRYNHEGLNINLNLDYQYAGLNNKSYFPLESTFKRNFRNALPNAVIGYRTENRTSFRLRYRTGTDEPSVNQLQNVINNNNPLNLSIGNPNLGQSFSNNLFLNISKVNIEKSRTLFIFLVGSFTKNYIGTSTFVAPVDTLINNEVLLRTGGQITRPVNLSGRWNSRGAVNYGTSIPALKLQFNMNSSIAYNRTPGMINGRVSANENIDLGQGFTLTSNISKDLDFTLSTSGTYSLVKSSLQTNVNNNYYIQNSNLRFYFSPNDGKLFLANNVNHMLYSGLSEGMDQSVWLWNIEAGYRFLKNNKGELKLTIFDLLGQNNSISRTISDITITDTYTNVLTRYGLVSFTYIIGSSKKSDPNPNDPSFRRSMPPRGGGRSW